ncbi:MAG: phosphoribosylformylglycinamidine cyclo-ligase [Desulfarculales bacterium]|jgi:phosphoribosylformylglycinamidine cyclo-ligase|nr:phosphoribosylformylglycinamidine cyclo-ligase [Desulfarculales bacterium]
MEKDKEAGAAPARRDRTLLKGADRYGQAGVNISLGNEFIEDIKQIVESTHTPSVLNGLGGFASLYSIGQKLHNPVLVSSTDGVGTKLKLAFMMDRHDTVGIDLVAMCINDVIVCGAKPLFMLDYLSTGQLRPQQGKEIITGIVEGCRQAQCALVGGETAEMPGFYAPGEYDLAGFALGIVEKEAVIDGSAVTKDSVLIGLASSGLHSNGFSLVRKIVFEELRLKVESWVEDLAAPLGETLLTPTRIYVSALAAIQKDFDIQALAHITGGGITENLPRVLPSSCRAVIHKNSWTAPPVFPFLRQAGKLTEAEMYRTFNCGLGMIVVLPQTQASDALARLNTLGYPACLIGEIMARKGEQAQVEIF